VKRLAVAFASSALIIASAGLAAYPSVALDGYEHDIDDRYVAIDRVPRLVGYGCKGSKGPLFANEEDHFPRCDNIEAW